MDDGIQVRGDVAVIKNGDCVTVMFHGDEAMARDLRDGIAKGISAARDVLREESWQRLADLQAALNRSLGLTARPRRTHRLRVIENGE